MLASASRMFVMEQSLGMSGGHAETFAFIRERIDRLERGDLGPLAPRSRLSRP